MATVSADTEENSSLNLSGLHMPGDGGQAEVLAVGGKIFCQLKNIQSSNECRKKRPHCLGLYSSVCSVSLLKTRQDKTRYPASLTLLRGATGKLKGSVDCLWDRPQCIFLIWLVAMSSCFCIFESCHHNATQLYLDIVKRCDWIRLTAVDSCNSC